MTDVVFMEGFDTFNSTGSDVGLLSRWIGGSGMSIIAGRFGGQAMRAGSPVTAAITTSPTFTAVSSFSFGCAIRFNRGSMTGNASNIYFRSGATYNLGIRFLTDGSMEFSRHTAFTTRTVLGTTAADLIQANVWHYIEMEIVISDTVGEVRVYLDNNLVLTLSAQDTNNAVTTINTVGFFAGASGFSHQCDYDDMYIIDAATRLGERRIDLILPTSDSSVAWVKNTGASNFAAVDDLPTVNSDTDYVQGSVVGDLDLYGFGDLVSNPATINAIRIVGYARKTDVGVREIALPIKSSGTQQDGTTFTILGTYNHYTRTINLDPNGSVAWTTAAVNALTAGVKVIT